MSPCTKANVESLLFEPHTNLPDGKSKSPDWLNFCKDVRRTVAMVYNGSYVGPAVLGKKEHITRELMRDW